MARMRIYLTCTIIGAAGVLIYANETPQQIVNARADLIVVEKQKHTLSLFQRGHEIAHYRIALGHGGLAPKRQEGDGLTPEGRYVIDAHKTTSAFHRALHISYPSPADQAAARARHANPGGAIMIHGLRNGFGWIGRLHRIADWTNGCVAVTDNEIDAISAAVPDGTPIEIRA